MIEFRLPDVGEGLEEAEVRRWLVAEGDVVKRDQPLVEVETDKALVELPSPVAGTVLALRADIGDIVKVGEVLIELDALDGAGAPPSRVKAAPSVRKLAVELGIDLPKVAGTGPGGRILGEDVRRMASPRPPMAPIANGRVPLRGLRRATAQAMARSWSEIPHITCMDEIDASALLDAHSRLKQEHDALTLTAFFVKAVVLALRGYPTVNASIDRDAGEIVLHDSFHIGIAVATDEGLVVPVLRDADGRGLLDVATEVGRLSAGARARSLGVEELRGGTFTITNYGAKGGRFATPLIRPPEVGIMGFGAIRERPFALGGEVVARPTLPWSFSADHRVIDGDVATAFAEDVAASLSDPIRLFL